MAPGDVTVTFNPLLGILAAIAFLGIAVIMMKVQDACSWLGAVTASAVGTHQLVFTLPAVTVAIAAVVLKITGVVGWVVFLILGLFGMLLSGMADPRTPYGQGMETRQ